MAIKDIVWDIYYKLTSRKFQCLALAVALFVYSPEHFGGWNLVAVMCIYIGGNVFQKYIDGRGGNGSSAAL